MLKKALLMLTVLFLSILVACSGNDEESSGNNNENSNETENEENGEEEAANDADPAEVRIMSHFFSPTPPEQDGEIEQLIEEGTNTDLSIEWVSANNYEEKFNVMLASGDLPDLMLVPDPFSPVFRQAAQQGAFWDVSPYIDDYPNIKEGIADIAWELTSMDGANYGIPRPRPSEGETFFSLRKDWLDNLGMEIPETSDELYEVMRAFTHDDPDQNGEDDTIGYAGYVNPTDMGNMGVFEGIFTGATGQWKDVDGELIHTSLLPETRDAIEFLSNAYQDGLIPEDFASLQNSQAQEMFKSGEAGMISEKAGAFQEVYDTLKSINPDFEFTSLYPLPEVNGYNPAGPGFASVNVISKSVPEEKMKSILQMINDWMEDDVFQLHRHGIEGVHHTVEDGEVVINTEKAQEDAIGDFNQIVYVSDPYASSVKETFPEEAKELYKEIQDAREETSVPDVSLGLYSETAQTYLPELEKSLQDLKTKIILGSETIEAWDSLVEELEQDLDMQAMTDEMNEAYQAR
ncbi:extracellular solute-binding protein [Gracilibacillus lacisalsi]|uniref:extracellular solute-binding protein n=1 Tax=Gracilibacillus lacisalsi TaxID=393087 RepID=UPI000364508E|nr:extracellular solute-binding protein [Gracilibacillus lacisalsi]